MFAVGVDNFLEGECEFDFGSAGSNHHSVALGNHAAELVRHVVAYVIIANHFGSREVVEVLSVDCVGLLFAFGVYILRRYTVMAQTVICVRRPLPYVLRR